MDTSTLSSFRKLLVHDILGPGISGPVMSMAVSRFLFLVVRELFYGTFLIVSALVSGLWRLFVKASRSSD